MRIASELVNTLIEPSREVRPARRVMLLRERHLVRTAKGRGAAWLSVERVRATDTRHEPVVARGAVLMIHGLGQNRFNFEVEGISLPGHLAAAGYDVFIAELRGHGRSHATSGHLPPRGYGDYVHEDAVAAVRFAHGLAAGAPLFLLGHSLGGAIVYGVTPLCRDEVAGVVAVSGVYHLAKQRVLQGVTSRAPRVAHTLRRGKGAYLPIWMYGRLMGAAARVFPLEKTGDVIRSYHPGSMSASAVRERFNHGFDRVSFGVMGDMWRLASSHGLAPLSAGDHLIGAEVQETYCRRFAACDVPLLVIAADRDRLVPPDAARPAFEESVSRDKTYFLAGWQTVGAHFGHLDVLIGHEAPRAIWPVITQFLHQRTLAPPTASL